MTSVVAVQKQINEIKQHTQVKSKDVITVHMWMPGDKDPPYNGGLFKIKALKRDRK